MSDLEMRRARREDIPAIVALLSDDTLGSSRETDAGFIGYPMAFEEISSDTHQFLAVGERDGEIVATVQVTYIPGLSSRGMRRAHINAVRVRSDQRGMGLGRQLMQWVIQEARLTGCGVIELMSHRSRTEAHRFYESLGFEQSHVAMKLKL